MKNFRYLQITLPLVFSVSAAWAAPAAPVAPAAPGYFLEITPVGLEDFIQIRSAAVVVPVVQTKDTVDVLVKGSCTSGSKFRFPPAAFMECADGDFEIVIKHPKRHEVLAAAVEHAGAVFAQSWLSLWSQPVPAELGIGKLTPHSVTQIYSGTTPVDQIVVGDKSNEQLVMRMHTVGDFKPEKTELFISKGKTGGMSAIQLQQKITSAVGEPIPWSVWGKTLSELKEYEYRTTLWANQKDYLGTIQSVAMVEPKPRQIDWRKFGFNAQTAFQSTNAFVVSIEANWQPNYRMGRVSLLGLVGLSLLKGSTGSVFPASRMLVGAGYHVTERWMPFALVGYDLWFLSGTHGALDITAGLQYQFAESRKRRWLGLNGFRASYSLLTFDPMSHVLRAGVFWHF